MILTIDICKSSWLRSTKTAAIVCTFLLSLILHGEHAMSKESVTVTFVDPEWSHDLTEHTVVADDRLKDFTHETGIDVRHLPTPETALDQLDLVDCHSQAEALIHRRSMSTSAMMCSSRFGCTANFQ
jgi:hypothetical protein